VFQHSIHVAGTRMIMEGTVGLLRGDLTERVMAGASMLNFVPLHLSALDQSPIILAWIKSWFGADNIEPWIHVHGMPWNKGTLNVFDFLLHHPSQTSC